MNWMWPVTQKGLAGACDNSKIIRVPLDFWFQFGKQAEQQYIVMEQQLYTSTMSYNRWRAF